MHLDRDAFASGQILSKLWLAETLERILDLHSNHREYRILNLGGWYGILHFILKSRNRIKIKTWKSIDIDTIACEIADSINETWVWQNWKFKSIVYDANTFQYGSDDFDLIINTSVEHMESTRWFENIPPKKIVVLQSNDMEHDDHVSNHETLDQFCDRFNLSDFMFRGQKTFQYDDMSFKRFMIIGVK